MQKIPMPKTTHNSRKDRIIKILNEFKNEYSAHRDNLYWLVCKIYVNCDRRSTILNHRDSKNHNIPHGRNSAPINRYIPHFEEKCLDHFVNGFVGADIPLSKLRMKPMIDLFAYLKVKIPANQQLEDTYSQILPKNHKTHNKFDEG